MRLGRKAILIELKKSYYRILLQNMKQIESKTIQPNLFTELEKRDKDINDNIDIEVGCLRD